jgi:hypothetical protein
MWLRFRWFAVAAAALVIAVTITVTVTNTPGQSVNFNAAGVYYGGVSATPSDVADFSALLESSSTARITVLAISLVPLPGFSTPKLVHVALLKSNKAFPAGTTGWPPNSGDGAGVYATRSAIGASIRIGKGQLPILVYGVSGTTSGRLYAVAGINVRFRVDGAIRTAIVLAGGFDCVQHFSGFATHSQMKWCSHKFSLADSRQWNLPAAQAIANR